MKKAITAIAIGAIVLLFAMPNPSIAYTPNWDVTGTYEWVVLGTYHHDVTITSQLPDGTFTGTAGYPAGSTPYNLPGQTTETITGYVDGNNITLTTTYSGPYNPGYTVTVSGTIDSTGYISGTSPWNWYMVGTATADDHDGLYGSADKCQGTEADTITGALGTNRWIWNGVSWDTVKSKGTGPSFVPTMDYTYGCSCGQILDALVDKTGLSFDGHYKYGCSKSVLEDWNRGTYHVGPTFVETVTVPANSATPTSSVATLDTGKDYFLKAYGTADAGDGIEFDAKYSFRTPTSTTWTDAVSTYESYGDTLLDLFVNGAPVNWGAFNPSHTYQIAYAGTNSPVSFLVNDIYPVNNTGNLLVDIIEDKWVNLW